MDKYILANAQFAKFSRNYMEHKKNLPIRPSEMGVLNIIVEFPGPHTSVMLARLLGVSKPMITSHLSVLLKKGYVTKQQSSEDKRVFYIQPTEKALSLVASAKKDTMVQLTRLVQEMGQDDFHNLIRLVEDANRILEAPHLQTLDEDQDM